MPGARRRLVLTAAARAAGLCAACSPATTTTAPPERGPGHGDVVLARCDQRGARVALTHIEHGVALAEPHRHDLAAPPPVVDLCAAFDQPVPTLRETAAPGSETTRGQVAALQRGLKRLGFDAGPVDGWYGPSTTAAVTAFQRDAGLPADGVMGERTWSVWFIDACGID
jgi:hypothetical protein